MKKISIFSVGLLGLLLTSCTTAGIFKTASTLGTASSVTSLTIADLDVSPERVTHTFYPSEDVQRGGEDNVRRAAEAEVLAAHNNADVLVDAQFVVTKESGSLFSKPKITSVTVTGHPAHYKNFHSVPAEVWDEAIAAATKVGHSNSEPKSGEFGDGDSKTFAVTAPKFNFKGARFEAYINGFGGLTFTGHHTDDDHLFAGGSLTVGCRLTPYLYIGVGASGRYAFEPECVYLPAYGDLRLYFNKGKISPFLDAKVGHSFVPGGKRYKGGLFVSPTLGYAFGRFEIGVQYIFQKCKFEPYFYEEDYKFDDHCIALSLGLRL